MPGDFRDYSFLDLDADLDGGMLDDHGEIGGDLHPKQGQRDMGLRAASLASKALGVATQDSALGQGVKDSVGPTRVIALEGTLPRVPPKTPLGGKLGLGPGHMSGVVTVQISVRDAEPAPGGAPGYDAPCRLVIYVSWGTGIGGGNAQIDATKGAVFTLGAVTSLSMYASILSIDDDGPIHPIIGFRPRDKIVEAVLLWNSAISPKESFFVPPRVDLVAGVESVAIPIPDQAISFLALARDPTILPTLEARFFHSTVVLLPSYATLNPNANGTPIVGGVRYVKLFSPVGGIVTPVFELNL